MNQLAMTQPAAYQKRSLPARLRFQCRRQTRSAITITEIVMATSLLAVAMMTTSVFFQRIVVGNQQARTMDAVRLALINAREEIGSWPAQAIDLERIQSITIADSLKQQLPQVRWQARIEDWRTPEKPVDAKLVVLALQWRDRPRSSLGSNDKKDQASPDQQLSEQKISDQTMPDMRQQSITFWVQP